MDKIHIWAPEIMKGMATDNMNWNWLQDHNYCMLCILVKVGVYQSKLSIQPLLFLHHLGLQMSQLDSFSLLKHAIAGVERGRWLLIKWSWAQYPARFLGIIGQNPSVPKSTWLHVVIFWYSFTDLRYIPQITLNWWVIFLGSWSSTGSSITSGQFSLFIASAHVMINT